MDNAAPQGQPPPIPPGPNSTTGLAPNVAAGLAVLFHWVGGLIVFLVEKDSAYAKFYALQSMALDVSYIAACFLAFILSVTAHIIRLPFTAMLGSGVFGVVFFVFWLILVINAFQGKVFELPIVGKWCRSQSGFTG
jgi:uncharacterized membrane protein